MKSVYLTKAIGSSAFYASEYLHEAREKTAKVGGKHFIIPASLVYDSRDEEDSGGHRHHLPDLISKDGHGHTVKIYSIPTIVKDKEEVVELWIKDEKGEPISLDLGNQYGTTLGIPLEHQDVLPVLKCRKTIRGKEHLGYVKNKAMMKHLAAQFLEHPNVLDVQEGDGCIKIILCSENTEWGQKYKEVLGIRGCNGGKVAKRLKSVGNKHLLYSTLRPEEMKFCLLDAVSLWEKKDKVFFEKTLDGLITISRGVHSLLVHDLEMRKLCGEDIPQETIDRVKNCRTFNGRIFIPAGILKEFPEGCLLKGQFFVTDKYGPDELVIESHVCNFKKEIRCDAGTPIRILATPQEGKCKSRTNIAFLANCPHIFHPRDVFQWFQKMVAGFLSRWKDGKMEDLLADIHESRSEKRTGKVSYYLSQTELLAEWCGNGLSLKNAPRTTVLDYLTGLVEYALKYEEADLRVPIPFATHHQIISNTAAARIIPGHITVPKGEIYFNQALKVYVVNDEDYVEHLIVNAGGSDQDDFYDVVFRMSEGKLSVFVLRNPNGWGEYSVFDLHGGFPHPAWNIKDVPDCHPEGSKMIADHPEMRSTKKGIVKTKLLPGREPNWDRSYGLKDFLEKFNIEGSVGSFINLVNLIAFLRRNDTLGIEDDESLAFSNEEVVDAFTQCDNPENLAILEGFKVDLWKKISERIAAGRKADRLYVKAKNLTDQFKPSELADTWFSKLLSLCQEEKKKYLATVEEEVPKVFRIPVALLMMERDPVMEENAKNFLLKYDSKFRVPDTVHKKDRWKYRTEKRKELVDAWKSRSNDWEKFVAHVAWHVYVNPDLRAREEKGDDKILHENRDVWLAWIEWLKRNPSPEGEGVPPPEGTPQEESEVGMNVDLSKSRISDAQKKWLSKDQYKSDGATCLLATDGSTGATGEYLRLWKEAGQRANDPKEGDVCFVSANGKRNGAKDPPFDLIKKAADLGCEFLTDARSRRPEGGNQYNTGEQKVAEFLRKIGYTETEENGGTVARWKKTVQQKKEKEPMKKEVTLKDIVTPLRIKTVGWTNPGCRGTIPATFYKKWKELGEDDVKMKAWFWERMQSGDAKVLNKLKRICNAGFVNCLKNQFMDDTDLANVLSAVCGYLSSALHNAGRLCPNYRLDESRVEKFCKFYRIQKPAVMPV